MHPTAAGDPDASSPNRLVAPDNCAGMRLDQALAGLVDGLSRSQAGALIRAGHCTVDGVPGKPSMKIKPGSVILLEVAEPKTDVFPAQIPLDIVFEDTSLIALNKPPGMPSHPAPGTGDETLLNGLVGYAKGAWRPALIHRLDRDTSGIIIASKTASAHRNLRGQMDSGVLKRTYLALAWGQFGENAGTVDAPIGRDRGRKTRMAVLDAGDPARTHYRVLGSAQHTDGPVSLVEVRLETGRTHQIRVHMEYIGHPLVGERVYRGGTDARGWELDLPGQMLHSWKVAFVHPETGEAMRLEANLPEAFNSLVDELGLGGSLGRT
ncbi:MAG: RluA family pseudouridine synthase [Armatimonadetes bacterium]|nr:RluA family pseudouridine synthase [Armatimonadota bacterium]